MTRVLVVEDNPAIRELVSAYVKNAGHSVAAATDGPEAIATVTDRVAPDIAVLDVAMPGMSGLDLLVKLRELPGMEGLPAIFLSARVKPEDIAKGTALGAAYLTKPFVGTALVNLIEKVLRPAATDW